jgi:hypothetical protein
MHQACGRELQQLRESEALESRRRTELRQQQQQQDERHKVQQQELQQRAAAAEAAAGRHASDKYYCYMHDSGRCFTATMHVVVFITDVAVASLGSEVTALRTQLIDQVTSSLNSRRRAFERL